MTRIRQSAAAILAAGILLITMSPAMADSKVGTVDIQQVFQKTKLGKAIQSHLKNFADRRISKMRTEQKALQDEQGQIRQQVR